LRQSLRVLLDFDPEAAPRVERCRGVLEDLHRAAHEAIDRMLRRRPRDAIRLLHLSNIASTLHQVGLSAMRVVEDVAAMAQEHLADSALSAI
jgi:hypothetical protein